MIKKLLISIVAILLIATNCWAISETTQGPKHITSCYMIGTTDVVSGSVVVLTEPGTDTTRTIEYNGREVTGSITNGEGIYGVVVDQRIFTPEQMRTGQWVSVQTYGYTPIVRVTTNVTEAGQAITAGNPLSTSHTAMIAASNNSSGAVTTGVVALSAYAGIAQSGGTVSGFIQ